MTQLHVLAPPPADRRLGRHLLTTGAGRLFLAFWGSLGLVDAARTDRSVALAASAALVALLAVHQPSWVALAVAGTCWLFLTGFVSHADGDLRGTGAADLARLLVLVVAAVASGAWWRRQPR